MSFHSESWINGQTLSVLWELKTSHPPLFLMSFLTVSHGLKKKISSSLSVSHLCETKHCDYRGIFEIQRGIKSITRTRRPLLRLVIHPKTCSKNLTTAMTFNFCFIENASHRNERNSISFSLEIIVCVLTSVKT